ncbi:hypothetical protein [Microcoleus sp. CAWBG51]|nr:hypothetical protein [Microcoleus sp. CAWBG51]
MVEEWIDRLSNTSIELLHSGDQSAYPSHTNFDINMVWGFRRRKLNLNKKKKNRQRRVTGGNRYNGSLKSVNTVFFTSLF